MTSEQEIGSELECFNQQRIEDYFEAINRDQSGNMAQFCYSILISLDNPLFVTTDCGDLLFISPQMQHYLGYSFAQIQQLENITSILGNRFELEALADNNSIQCQINQKSLTLTIKPVNISQTVRLFIFQLILVDLNHESNCDRTEDITSKQDLKEVLRQQLERERLLLAITQRIRQSLDLQTILQTTVSEVRQLLAIDRVVIYRFNPDWSGAAIVESVINPELGILGLKIDDPCFRDHLLEKYRRGRLSVVHDIDKASLTSCHCNLLKKFGVKSNLVVPIIVNEQLWGLLISHNCAAARIWQWSEVELLQQLSHFVAIAIQQSQLYEQSRQQARREALINEIVDQMRSTLDQTQILKQAACSVRSALDVSRCHIGLLREADEAFELNVEATEAGVATMQGQPIPLRDNPHAQQVISQEQPLAIDDVSQSPLMRSALPLAEQFDIEAMLAVAIRFQGKVRGILSVQQCSVVRRWTEDEHILLKEVADQLAVAIEQAELYHQLNLANQELQRIAILDSLTGLANRRHFDQYLEDEWKRLSRELDPISLILLDIDYFKLYNDHYGHQEGDHCLQLVAQCLAQSVKRPADLVARYGGEEFAIILPNTNSHGAVYVAHKSRAKIRDLAISHHQSPVSDYVTISIGIATLIPNQQIDAAELIKFADLALYQAKTQGRDRVVIYSN